MKKFLIKISVALGVVILLHIITAYLFANGKIDSFYVRFTSPEQHAFVLGNSRAAQGVIPNIVSENITAFSVEGPLFTYAFTLSTSPYGPYYLESIKRKMDHSTKNGLFIICVDPWSVSSDARMISDDPAFYAEAKTIPFNVKFVNMNPNWEYLVKNFHKGWGDMIIANTVRRAQTKLHKNGWLEVNVLMDTTRIKDRIKTKLQLYRQENFYSKKFSSIRLAYLKKTIEYLKSFGKVYLIRIPLDLNMAQIEKEYLPEFDKLIEDCAEDQKVIYLNYVANQKVEYRTTDGNHLYKEDAKIFSKRLAEDINQIEANWK